MTEKILIGVGWPYPNGSLHLGQIAGAYLPPDIFARYNRVIGNRVVMVSGSDQNGTPIVVRAEQEGKTPQDIVDRFHTEYLDNWERLGISLDLYTSTGTQNHIETSQEIFLKLYEQGDLYLKEMELTYCVRRAAFLPDRYVEGTCPNCGYDGARGDQCDNCGKTLDPTDLINPRCRLDGSTPERRLSEHFFLRLSAYNDQVMEWLSNDKEHWRRPVLNFSLGVLNEGLQDRAITRDLEWGVPIPLPGYETSASTSGSRTSSATLSDQGVGAEPGHAGSLARLLGGPGREDLLLHRQGQHLVPHPELAGAGHDVRRPQPALRRAGEPVRQLRRLQGEHQPRHGAVPAPLPREVRRRHAALLPQRDHAGDQRQRVQRRRPRFAATTRSWSPPGATWSTAS